MIYRGYTIEHHPSGPATGTWVAHRLGVGLCASTKEALMRMIDTRITSAQRAGAFSEPQGYRIP